MLLLGHWPALVGADARLFELRPVAGIDGSSLMGHRVGSCAFSPIALVDSAIPIISVLPHRYPGDFRRAPRYPKGVAPLRRPSRHRKTVDAACHRSSPERRGERVHQVSHLARDETARRYRPQRPPGRGQMVLSGRKFRYRRQARERSDADSEPTATGI